MSNTVSGERATTSAGGFNPSWQRHRANYRAAASFLGEGKVLDLACGVGHSLDLLAPRTSVGVDTSPEVLADQPRETIVADMRRLPLADGEFESIVCSHAIEHVPDPERVVAEAARVLSGTGTAVFTTPNRLTFARRDEIIDPYHFVEWSPREFEDLCRTGFEEVDLHGLFGSERHLALVRDERLRLDALLRKDPLRLRRFIPRRIRQRLYDRRLTVERADPPTEALEIGIDDFELRSSGLEDCLDLVAVCRAPRAGVAGPGIRR